MATLFKVLIAGAMFGVLAAVVGLAIETRNVDLHGAESSSYEAEWLTVGALPGKLIVEGRHGGDFRLGEIRWHQRAVIGWNALAYGTLAAAAFRLVR